MSILDPQTKLLAAIAYGEASPANLKDEFIGIAHTVMNRCRIWGNKTVEQLIAADPNYTYVVQGKSKRYNNFMEIYEIKQLSKDAGKLLAWESAQEVLANSTSDPSHGAFWWDGVDFSTNFSRHPKVIDGFKFGSPDHNIFGVKEQLRKTKIYWIIKNKNTGKEVASKVRGEYTCVWLSTAAIGKTIFWKHSPEYLAATGCKEYR